MQAGSDAKSRFSDRASTGGRDAKRNTGTASKSCRQRPVLRDGVGRRTYSAGLSRQRRQVVATASQQADVVTSFVKEEVDGEGTRQDDLPS